MEGGPQVRRETRRGGHTYYYATNTRIVGAVGEKSGENRICNTKCRKNWPFMGERLPSGVPGFRARKDLHTEQPPRRRLAHVDAGPLDRYDDLPAELRYEEVMAASAGQEVPAKEMLELLAFPTPNGRDHGG
jgi:hypothetical protein